MKVLDVTVTRSVALAAGLAVLTLAGGTRKAAATVVDAFYFTGNGYVAAGQTETLTPDQGYAFNASENFEKGASLSVIQTNYTNSWYVDFGALGNQLLAQGYYGNANRYPFNRGSGGEPLSNGLAFYGDGRGDNQLTGEFYVFEISYGAAGTITSFAADFIQHDENSTTSNDFGSIRYNSDVPLDTPATVPLSLVPEPSSSLLLLSAALGVLPLWRRLRKRGSNSLP